MFRLAAFAEEILIWGIFTKCSGNWFCLSLISGEKGFFHWCCQSTFLYYFYIQLIAFMMIMILLCTAIYVQAQQPLLPKIGVIVTWWPYHPTPTPWSLHQLMLPQILSPTLVYTTSHPKGYTSWIYMNLPHCFLYPRRKKNVWKSGASKMPSIELTKEREKKICI